MSLAIDDVFVAFRSDTQDLERGINKATSELGKLADYIKAKPTIAIAGMSVAFAGVAFSAAQAAGVIEASTTRIANAIPGATGKIAQLQSIIDGVADASGRLGDEIQGVSEVIAHEGVDSVDGFLQRLALVTQTGNATGGSLEGIATGLHGLQQEFGLTDDALKGVVVSLFGLTQGKIPIDELTDGILHAAPAVRNLGLDLDTTERAMAALIERGRSVKNASAELEKYAKLGETGKDDILALAASVSIAADAEAKFNAAAKATATTEEAEYNRVKNKLSEAWHAFGVAVLPAVTISLKAISALVTSFDDHMPFIDAWEQISTGADRLATAADNATGKLSELDTALSTVSGGIRGGIPAVTPSTPAKPIPTADQEIAAKAAADKAAAGVKEFNAQLADLHGKALEAEAALGGPLLAAWEALNTEIDKSLTALSANKYGTTAGIDQAATDAAALRQQFWTKALSDYLADSAKYAAAFEDSTKEGLASTAEQIADLNEKLKGTAFAAAGQQIVDAIIPSKDKIAQLQALFTALQLGNKNLADANRDSAAGQQEIFQRTQDIAAAQGDLDVATLDAAGKTHAARLKDLDDRQAQYEATLQQHVAEDASYAAVAAQLIAISRARTAVAKGTELQSTDKDAAELRQELFGAASAAADLLVQVGAIGPAFAAGIKDITAFGGALQKSLIIFDDPTSSPLAKLQGVIGLIQSAGPLLGSIANTLGLGGESAAQKAQDDRNAALTQAIVNLTSAFNSYKTITVSGATATALATAGALSESTARPTPGGIPPVKARLDDLGVSLADFNAEAASLGITIGNSVNPSIADFNNVVKAASFQKFDQIAHTFAGQLDQLNTHFSVFGVTGTDQFAPLVKLLTDPTVGAPALFSALQGIDVSTTAGAAQARSVLQGLQTQFENGDLANLDFGGLTPQQFEDEIAQALAVIPAVVQQVVATADQVKAETDSLAVRNLTAEGDTAGAAALKRQQDENNEIKDAIAEGLDPATVAQIQYTDALEDTAAAALAAKDADKANADELAALNVRNLIAEGNAAGAAAAQRAIDEGNALTDAISNGLSDATQQQIKYTEALEDSAAAAKTASDAAQAEQDEKDALQVRLLRAQGDTAGADALQRQIDDRNELKDAIAKGFTQATLDEIKATQGAEDAAAAQAAAAANATADAGAADDSNHATITSNIGETLDLVGLQESANALLTLIVGNTASLRAGGPLRPPALPAGFGAPVTQTIAQVTFGPISVVVNLTAGVDPDAAAAAGQAAGQAAAAEINRQLGAIKLRQDYNRGVNRAVGV